jgi:peptide-methionine (S)-S-oxide reductase
VEAVFEAVRGVKKVESGYAGGAVVSPTYELVCTGSTGHAEVVQVTFDPKIISFRDILLVFFGTHDPTTPNRQGADVGTQYRSAIFYHSEAQKQTAQDVIKQLEEESKGSLRIVTEVTPLTSYFPAEAYHQGYFRNHPHQGYCSAVIPPKLAKLRKYFSQFLAEPEATT